jgi:hypothetical protein
MALSLLQLNVLRTAAINDVVPLAYLVSSQEQLTGARRTVRVQASRGRYGVSGGSGRWNCAARERR